MKRAKIKYSTIRRNHLSNSIRFRELFTKYIQEVIKESLDKKESNETPASASQSSRKQSIGKWQVRHSSYSSRLPSRNKSMITRNTPMRRYNRNKQ